MIVARHHATVPGRERAADRGAARGERILHELAMEVREARLSAGLTQRQVARAVGTSRSQISRIEHAALGSVSVRVAAKLTAVVGLDLSVRCYPAATRLRDAAQLELLRRFKEDLGPAWSWRNEVPLPLEGDQRAWDAVGHHRATALAIAVDAENRICDVQAFLRREALKRRDGHVERLVVLVRNTRSNRGVLREAASEITEAFPVASSRALRALASGLDPGGDAVVLLATSTAAPAR